MESDGKNVYMCFHCNFALCVRCLRNHFGTTVTPNDGTTETSTNISDSTTENATLTIEIGDEVLKLPPSYDESRRLCSEPPPRYDLCTSL